MVASEAAPSTPTTRAPGLGGALHLGAAGVHGLHVGHDDPVRPAGLDGADGLQALALDEGGAGFQPVGASGDRLFGHLQGAGQVDEVESQLQHRFHEAILLDRRMTAYDAQGLHDDRAFPGTVVEADEADLLPPAQAQLALLEREDQRGAQQAGAHVGVAVDVGVGDVVFVVLSRGR